MRLKPGWIILIVIAVGFAVFFGGRSFLEYRRPPELTVTVPGRAPAGELFEVMISSNKPLDMNLDWAGVSLPGQGTDWSVFLPAAAGDSALELEVRDRAGNVVSERHMVTGVAAPELTMLSASALLAGDPLAGLLLLDAGDNVIADVSFTLGAETLPQFEFDGNHVGITALPLSLEGQQVTLRATVTDEFGRRTVAERDYDVQPIDRQVEVLQLAQSVLELQTEENSRAQAARFSEASASLAAEALWSQPFLLPMQGFGSSGYGDPRRYFEAGEVSFHMGTDLAAPAGTQIRATNDGIVILAESLPLAGGTVVIDHGAGVTSRYYHQNLILTQVGERVQRGDVIGEVGSTGISTGPHLHWEMRIGEASSNPLEWVDRLLPGIDGP